MAALLTTEWRNPQGIGQPLYEGEAMRPQHVAGAAFRSHKNFIHSGVHDAQIFQSPAYAHGYVTIPELTILRRRGSDVLWIS
jgi:hypothetical protein